MMRKVTIIAIIAIAAAGTLAAAFGARNKLPAAIVPVYRIADKYGSPQQFMEGLYAADHEPASAPAKAAVVPHHLVAAKSIALGIKAVAVRRPSRILIVSPDHFDRCPTLVCTGNLQYTTQLGEVAADSETIKKLSASPLVTQLPELFLDEHGIHAVAPFIAYYLPGVPMTPLVISSAHGWKISKDKIVELVGSVLGPEDALVVSSDFSHYLSLGDADKMDALTSEALVSGDLATLEKLKQPDQSDCPGCLWAIASLAKSRGWGVPEILIHSNSAIILGDPKNPSTTSHFSIIWR